MSINSVSIKNANYVFVRSVSIKNTNTVLKINVKYVLICGRSNHSLLVLFLNIYVLFLFSFHFPFRLEK